MELWKTLSRDYKGYFIFFSLHVCSGWASVLINQNQAAYTPLMQIIVGLSIDAYSVFWVLTKDRLREMQQSFQPARTSLVLIFNLIIFGGIFFFMYKNDLPPFGYPMCLLLMIYTLFEKLGVADNPEKGFGRVHEIFGRSLKQREKGFYLARMKESPIRIIVGIVGMLVGTLLMVCGICPPSGYLSTILGAGLIIFSARFIFRENK
jgi:hypothetical protein